ncbi:MULTISPECIES: SlyX family protein [unclassified Pedobacter]|uniref:SlyX family protein n=1 Tax=unclassified Pedobacter TaxID=2628915 RepID=UPI001D64346C|nr:MULTISPECIES: SlyX family protein [unclassified Pedobacter]CAH0277432.1 hypothetical protein SRABI36_03920 [Pedobacter sp. Bi36]CAH0294675.1 hypothetical protein SRABI126_04164 [Pedobacter sp. Bi126]
MKNTIKLSVLLLISIFPLASIAQTQTRDNAGLQGNAGAVSGFFETVNPINYPAGASNWWHLLDVRHSNSVNNFAMQFAGSFFDQNLYFRKTSNNAGQTWSKVLLETNGNVGIGTTNPRGVLDIATHIPDGMLGAVLGRLPEGDGTGNGTFVGVQGFNTNVLDGKSFSILHNFYGETNSSINFHRGKDVTGGFISFNTSSNLERMRIDAFGNVGIGTLTPREKLSVNGNIRAKEIKVEATNWPDYVFEEGYKVGTLKGLESYIKTNKHLPGMPSAKEVERNGVELGEMNKLLLKKIEELTLHLIEHEHKMNEQSDVLVKQQKEISELKEKIK